MAGLQKGQSESMGNISILARIHPGEQRRIVARVRDHELVMDMPEVRGGNNSGPTPPECLAVALGGCLVNIARVMAEQKQIPLKDIRVEVAGDIDPSRAMGLGSENRAGFMGLSVKVGLDAERTRTEMKEFIEELKKRCALCDTIANPVPLKLAVDFFGE